MSKIIDLDSRRARPFGRTPLTDRGGKVMDEVANAARRLLVQLWSHEVTVVAVAGEARVARASLLWQFEGGMPDVLNTVLLREMNAFDEGFEYAVRMKGASPVDRTIAAFAPLFLRAESSGRLFANLRGAMFTWGTENSDIYRKGLNDYIDMTVELLKGAAPSVDPAIARLEGHIAEGIFNTCLDLLAYDDNAESSWGDRREAFRSIVTTAVAGVRQLSRKAGKRSHRVNLKRRAAR